MTSEAGARLEPIAVVGMSCRVPGADTIDRFWQNLCAGVESIRRLSDDELRAAGVDDSLLRNPNYVKAKGVLEDIEMFDAGFFGIPPREAEIMDPQHRLFLECAWETLEHAGHDPERSRGRVGVFAGCGMNGYLLNHLDAFRALGSTGGDFPIALGNDKDFLATRVSYKLNLKGPSVTVNTACSTSLVAVVMASQSLLGYQCDMALAGGATVQCPHRVGYL